MSDTADDSEYLSASETAGDENSQTDVETKSKGTLTPQTEKLAPLATKWTFWLDRQNSKSSSKEDYEAALKIVSSVETVQEFWSIFNSLPAPNLLANRVSYHLMRQSLKPLWEDEENKNGGIYTYRCQKDKTNSVWLELCLAAIGEQFSDLEGDDVVGITVQSRETGQDIVQVWNCDPSEKAQAAIDQKMSSLFPGATFTVKFYKANSSHAKFEGKH